MPTIISSKVVLTKHTIYSTILILNYFTIFINIYDTIYINLIFVSYITKKTKLNNLKLNLEIVYIILIIKLKVYIYLTFNLFFVLFY